MVKNLCINDMYNGVEISLDFTDRINLIKQSSGTGKTFLFKILGEYCREQGVKYFLFDYRSKDLKKDFIISVCSDFDVICFDNADLYLTSALFNDLVKLNKIIIISIKNTDEIETKRAGLYLVKYTPNNLFVRRRG